MKEEEAEGMPCLEAEPESWQTEGAGGLGGTTSVSSDSCGAQPAPIRLTKPRWHAGKMGTDRASPSRGFREALPRRARGDTGGTTFAMLASRFAFPAGPLRGASSALPSASVVSSDFCGAKASPQSRWQETSACRLSAQFQQAAEGVFDEAVRATGARCDADGQVFTIRQPVRRNDFFFRVQVEMLDFNC